jgi:methyl-accepting chemotaxis protein
MAREDMANMTGRYANDISAYYQQFMDQAETLAFIMGGFETFDIARRRELFLTMMRQLFEHTPELRAIYTVWRPGLIDHRDEQFIGKEGMDAQGNFIPAFVRTKGKINLTTHQDAAAILSALSDGNIVDEPKSHIRDGDTAFSVSFRSPITADSSGQVVGFAGVTVDLAGSQQIIENIAPYGNGYAALYSHKGSVAAHHETARLGESIFDSAARASLGEEGISLIHSALNSGDPVSFIFQGRITQIYPFYIGDSETAWAVAATAPTGTVLSRVHTMTRFTILIFLASILITGGGLFLLITKVSNSVVRVSEPLKDISKGSGDLTQELTVNINSITETNVTVEQIAGMVSDREKHIRSAMEEQNSGSRQIQAIGQLNDITRLVTGGSEKMFERSREVVQESKNLKTVTQEINTSIKEIAARAIQLNTVVNQIKEISRINRQNIETLVQEASRFKVE